MRKSVGFTLALMVMLTSLFGREKKPLPDVRSTVEITEVDSQLLRELIQGVHSDIVVECKEGTIIPIQFLYKTSLLSANLAPNLGIKVEKTCYLRFLGNKVYVSEDLSKWEKAKNYLKGKTYPSIQMNSSGALVEANLVPYSE